jgi:hypothetical protein
MLRYTYTVCLAISPRLMTPRLMIRVSFSIKDLTITSARKKKFEISFTSSITWVNPTSCSILTISILFILLETKVSILWSHWFPNYFFRVLRPKFLPQIWSPFCAKCPATRNNSFFFCAIWTQHSHYIPNYQRVKAEISNLWYRTREFNKSLKIT